MILESLTGAILISGLVTIMMMMIECINIESKGAFFTGLAKSRIGGILTGAFLGVIPGCMGGFATVSLYTHGMLSFGALVAMMIASSGDEAFVLLATVPDKALWIFCILLGIAIASGLLCDVIFKKQDKMRCNEQYEVHNEDRHNHKGEGRRFGWKRIVMLLGTILFITALLSGLLEHEEGHEAAETGPSIAGINLLSEEWMNWLFAALSLIVLAVLTLAPDHFVEEHLWHHVIVKHLPSIFAWTFGALLLIGTMLKFWDISAWINTNTALMILLATLVGVIPESGPHLIFVTLYASGIIPLPVLLASCISQDGHASLPLLAESKKSFLKAKAVNCAVALIAGFGSMLLTL